jgi:hypothetical protein
MAEHASPTVSGLHQQSRLLDQIAEDVQPRILLRVAGVGELGGVGLGQLNVGELVGRDPLEDVAEELQRVLVGAVLPGKMTASLSTDV